MDSFQWTKAEKKIAKTAIQNAYEKEIAEIRESIQKMIDQREDDEIIWKVLDYLLEKQYEINEKYDFRTSALLMVLIRLIGEKRISLENIEGLSRDKIKKLQSVRDIFLK